MPRGASPKREREYRELENRFEEEGRYKGREKEVAARIVNKQRRRFGETKGQQKQERQNKSPDRGLPISSYRHQTIGSIKRKLPKLSRGNLQKLERYEKSHKNRRTLLEEFERALSE